MTMNRVSVAIGIVMLLAVAGAAVAWSQLPAIGAGAQLAAWVCAADDAAGARATIVYLHGISDNRDSSTGVIDRFLQRGFNVVSYDSRAHGRSEGDRCTYGFFEKQDLQRVLDQSGVNRAILIGHSLGAAVALQAAAIDRRVLAVVAASTFADLRSIATERAPFVFTPPLIEAAFARAEHDGQFIVDEASPLRAAPAITVPVLLVHGTADRNTRSTHSERVYAALGGPKQLLLVHGAAHVDVFRSEVWATIERWIDALP
jgi:uncharacterized protein